MKTYPSISVLMPVYNCEKYIRDAVESVLNQTYSDFEFIIVNDGSTDNTPNIINEYASKDSRVKVINQPNNGIVAALNFGLNTASGDWIFRMDGDDISLPDRFALQVEAIRKDSSLLLLGSGCQQINSLGKVLKINRYPFDQSGLIHCLLTMKPFFPHPTACFHRATVIQLGGYRERFQYAEDIDLWLRILEVGKFECLPNILLKLRKHANNISYLHTESQQLLAMAALVCFFKRRYNLADPSVMKINDWLNFLERLKKRLNDERLFQAEMNWIKLKEIYYSAFFQERKKNNAILLKLKMIIGHPITFIKFLRGRNKKLFAQKSATQISMNSPMRAIKTTKLKSGNQSPKISAITSCYNAERFMTEAIESILNQSFKEFEYILIDDGSIDNTLSLMKKYALLDKRIKVIEKRNTGLTDSLNWGLRVANGEWVARLDSDDIALPQRFAKQMEYIKTNKDIVLLGTGCIEMDENGSPIKTHHYPNKHNLLMKRLERGEAFFPHSSAFVKKEIVERLGGYNCRFVRSQDWDLWLRIGETAYIACLSEPLIRLRKHSEMLSNIDSGIPQQIMSISARVCHFRREAGLSDPSQLGEDIWLDFLEWVKKSDETRRYLAYFQQSRVMREIWYDNSGKYRSSKMMSRSSVIPHSGPKEFPS